MGVLQVPFLKLDHLWERGQKCTFSFTAPALWNIIPSEVWMAQTRVAFLKPWFFAQTLQN